MLLLHRFGNIQFIETTAALNPPPRAQAALRLALRELFRLMAGDQT